MLRRPHHLPNVSPMRSPIKSNNRPVSPFRASPFIRQQAPMSPIRVRKFERSITPNKQQRIQLTKRDSHITQNYDSMMQKTLKNGVGLFQQLAHQQKNDSQKIGFIKKISQQTAPSDYHEKKKENSQHLQKNAFATHIQNVPQIESMQASKVNQNSQHSNSKIHHTQDKIESRLNQTFLKRKNTQPAFVLESFGTPKNDDMQENEKQENCKINEFQLCPSTGPLQQRNIKLEENIPQKKMELINSFEDILFLIRKASNKQDQRKLQGLEQSVKVSFSNNKDSISFDMSPFI